MANDFPSFRKKMETLFDKTFSKRQLNEIGKTIADRIKTVTDKGQTFAEGRIEKLKKLADSTKKQKRRKGLPTRPRLRDTGDMINSVNYTTNVSKKTVTVQPTGSFNKEKASFAHDGSSNRPPRPFIPTEGKLDRRTTEIILNKFGDGLRKELRKLFKS